VKKKDGSKGGKGGKDKDKRKKAKKDGAGRLIPELDDEGGGAMYVLCLFGVRSFVH
jgi:hypothetical protein